MRVAERTMSHNGKLVSVTLQGNFDCSHCFLLLSRFRNTHKQLYLGMHAYAKICAIHTHKDWSKNRISFWEPPDIFDACNLLPSTVMMIVSKNKNSFPQSAFLHIFHGKVILCEFSCCALSHTFPKNAHAKSVLLHLYGIGKLFLYFT